MHRHPAVSGRFYAARPEALRRQVEGYTIPDAEKVKALGILSPHAGLMYSGPVAGAVYSSVHLPDTFILIGPNHTGFGAPVSVMSEGTWEMPFGAVEIDTVLARSILSHSPLLYDDPLAHLHEHSLEVQLPFIRYFKTNFKIVPIQMLDVRLETCLEVGRAVAEGIRNVGQRAEGIGPGVLIVASSDMSHYESAAAAKEKDFKAINRILELDPEGLHRTVKQHGITMCGYGPTVAMLAACKILGASSARLVKYANSGDVSGDFDQVVGYAGIVVV